jgi:flagellin
MSELKTLSTDVTKNTTDVSNYNTEFQALQQQLSAITSEKFNSVSLFTSGASATTLSVATTEANGNAVNISQAALGSSVSTVLTDTNMQLTSVGLTAVTNAIQNVATLRASNGAQTSRLQFASDMLTVNKQNLESANSRIMDVDVASESTQLARFNILVQAGSSMLSQANSSSSVALRLLG